MAKEVTVLGIEGAFLRGVRLEERNGAFTCTDAASWPLGEEPAETTLTAEETAAVAAAVVGALDDGRSSSADSAGMTVETVVEEDKPLARAFRAAAKHFEQTEFTLSLPLSKLLVKSVRMPVEAREDLLGAALLELDGISPFPDEVLTPAAEVVAETDSEIQVVVSALPASAAEEIGLALAAAHVHVTRTDATALGWLRILWPRLCEVEARRRLVLLDLGDGWDLAVLDDGAPVQLRGIGAVDSAAALGREVTLSLLACEAAGADVDDVVVCSREQPGSDVLGRLSMFGPVRTLLVEDPEAGVEGCARREAEGGTFDVTPAVWAEARTESRFRRKLKMFLAVAVGLWALVMGVLFGYEIVYNKMRDHQKELRKGAHKIAYEEVAAMTNRVAIIDRYEDRSLCALEMFRIVTESMPDDEGMTFDYFRFIRGDSVTVRGKASSLESSRQLAEDNLSAMTVPRRNEDGEIVFDEDGPPLFATVKRSPSPVNSRGLFPFVIDAKFPVAEEEEPTKGRSK